MSTGELVVVFLLVIAVLSCVAGRWLRCARHELELEQARRRLERACWHLSAEDLVFAAWRLRQGEVLDTAEWLEERADDMAALGIVDGAFE